MEQMIRKRVTRVGSGAWSVYLPKKWVDAWTPEQREGREVDLYTIGEAIVIAPVLMDRNVRGAVENDARSVRRVLLSAYVRGATSVHLSPIGAPMFSNEVILAARDFLRHLDERIVATVRPETIEMRINPDLPPPVTGTDAAMVLVARVQEALNLAGEAITTFPHDQERTLHTLRLLRDTVDLDIARIFYQTLRVVATIDLPVQSVSDLQLLDLTAAQLDRIGRHTRAIAGTLLDLYGLTIDDLDYPIAHLRGQARLPDLPGTAMQDAARDYAQALKAAADGLGAGAAALSKGDTVALRKLQAAARATQNGLQEVVFEAMMEAWAEDLGPGQRRTAYGLYQVSTPIHSILGNLAAIAHHAITITAVVPLLDDEAMP